MIIGFRESMNDYQLKNLERITFNPRIMAGQACKLRRIYIAL